VPHYDVSFFGQLRDVIVLAVVTSKVASQGCYGIGSGAGKKIEQRLLFYRVHCPGYNLAVHETGKFSVTVLPDPTYSLLRISDLAAAVTTQITVNQMVI
jgi:hypothetical protein